MRFVFTGLMILTTLVASSAADARHRHGHRHHHADARHMTPHAVLGIDYRHNYGPGPFPGTFSTYDGDPRALCRQSSANYRGQNGRLYPCS